MSGRSLGSPWVQRRPIWMHLAIWSAAVDAANAGSTISRLFCLLCCLYACTISQEQGTPKLVFMPNDTWKNRSSSSLPYCLSALLFQLDVLRKEQVHSTKINLATVNWKINLKCFFVTPCWGRNNQFLMFRWTLRSYPGHYTSISHLIQSSLFLTLCGVWIAW